MLSCGRTASDGNETRNIISVVEQAKPWSIGNTVNQKVRACNAHTRTARKETCNKMHQRCKIGKLHNLLARKEF